METKEYVEWLLKSYHETKYKLQFWGIQIENFKGLSYDGTIEGLTFTTPEGERVQTSNISDKSGRIALSYRDFVENQNKEVLQGMMEQYYTLKNDLDLLDYAISLLDDRLSCIITDMFINKLSWDEMCDKYYVSRNMLSKYRKRGVYQVAKIFGAKQVG